MEAACIPLKTTVQQRGDGMKGESEDRGRWKRKRGK